MTQPLDPGTPGGGAGQADGPVPDDAATEPLVTGTGTEQTATDQQPDPAEVEGPRRRPPGARRTTRRPGPRDGHRRGAPGGQAQGHRAAGPRAQTRCARRCSGLKMLLITVLLVIVGIGLALVLYFTPAMSARNIVVVGTGVVTREEVLDAAQVRLGTPLLQINTSQVADRVAAIRRVASARVQRQYPSALRITIVERVPVAVKDFPDGPHLFDRDGVDFATGPPPPALPYLDVADPGPNDAATKAALQVLTALRPEVADQVGRVAAPSVASITLTLGDGRVVIWGPPTARTRRPRSCPRC